MCLYGTVAAMVRRDDEGVTILLDDLTECLPDVEELLIAVSVATLERLEAAVGAGPGIPPAQGRPIAQELLCLAQSFHRSEPDTVQFAAWRLDAVRQGDRHQAHADIAGSLDLATDRDLVLGGAALLAATVLLWARRTGQDPSDAAKDLCLAASLDLAG